MQSKVAAVEQMATSKPPTLTKEYRTETWELRYRNRSIAPELEISREPGGSYFQNPHRSELE